MFRVYKEQCSYKIELSINLLELEQQMVCNLIIKWGQLNHQHEFFFLSKRDFEIILKYKDVAQLIPSISEKIKLSINKQDVKILQINIEHAERKLLSETMQDQPLAKVIQYLENILADLLMLAVQGTFESKSRRCI